MLKKHIKLNHGDTIFFCPSCDYSSKYNESVSAHEKSVHEGIKNHKCEICDKEFSNKKYLNTHKNAVHFQQNIFSCIQSFMLC